MGSRFVGKEVIIKRWVLRLQLLHMRGKTSIAVNVGGAVIPVLMSIFLFTFVKPIDAIIGVLVMTAIVYKIAKPVKGSGIAIHALLPPFLAVAIALMISPPEAPVIAYISGTHGCLIGVDILNLKKIPDLGMNMVSIGGAGTFDAIFLTGVISVLLVRAVVMSHSLTTIIISERTEPHSMRSLSLRQEANQALPIPCL